WRDDGFDTGPTAAHVFELVESGMAPEAAVKLVHEWHNRLTAGCNPAHRAPVLAAAQFLPDDTLLRTAADEAALTHYDPLAGEVSAAVVMLCRALIRGMGWDAACIEVAAKLPPRTGKLLTARTTVEKLHAGGYAPHVLEGALHFARTHPTFETALTMSIKQAGWGNYIPVLVGALGGARWGMSGIPGSEILKSLDILPDLHATADRLAAKW
ncbi:MAG: ADP-ribosylglycohydrolase family protein, partial [Chloroflexota bacterium]